MVVMAFRSYQKIYGQKMTRTTFVWGGTTYSHILHLDGDAVPDSVEVSDYTKVYGVGSWDTPTLCIEQNHVLPYPFDIASAIDGTVSGTLKAVARGSGDQYGSMAKLTELRIQLFAVDSDGNQRDLSGAQTVWSGTEVSSYDNLKTVAIEYWFLMSAHLTADERLVLNVRVYGYSGGYTGNVLADLKLYHTKNTDELSITLPFII
jgi:hypothetical protein